jgi:hypothetical protein
MKYLHIQLYDFNLMSSFRTEGNSASLLLAPLFGDPRKGFTENGQLPQLPI